MLAVLSPQIYNLGLCAREQNEVERKMKLASIIIATYNAEETISQTIESIAPCINESVELIIIDGNSKDETTEIISRYESLISYYISEDDLGVYDAWNKGIKQAQGEWICFIGGDDYIVPENFSALLKDMKSGAYDKADFIYSRIDIINSNSEIIKKLGRPWRKSKKLMLQEMSIPHPGLMHNSRTFAKKVFNPNYKIAGDYEFLLFHLTRGASFHFFDHTIISMRQGGLSSSKNNLLTVIRETEKAKKEHGIKLKVRYWGWLPRAYTKRLLLSLVGENGVQKAIKAYQSLSRK